MLLYLACQAVNPWNPLKGDPLESSGPRQAVDVNKVFKIFISPLTALQVPCGCRLVLDCGWEMMGVSATFEWVQWIHWP